MLKLIKRIFSKPAPAEPDLAPSRLAQPASVGPALSAPVAAPAAGISRDAISLPVQDIAANLPPAVRIGWVNGRAPQAVIRVPVEKILPQLKSGAVRLAFSELRDGSPPGVFPLRSSADRDLIPLPLNRILPQLQPAHFRRRFEQRTFTPPAEMREIFGANGKPAMPEPADFENPTPVAPSFPPPREPARPVEAPSFPGANRPATSPQPVASSPVSPLPPAPPSMPIRPQSPLPQPEALRSSSISPGASLSQTLRDIGKPAAATPDARPNNPAQPGEFIKYDLGTLLSFLPEHLASKLKAHSFWAELHLPLVALEPMLRRGKVAFTFRQLGGWLRPESPHWPATDEEILLPLQKIIPLFLASRKPAPARAKAVTGVEIPDLFSDKTRLSPPAAPGEAGPCAKHPPAMAPSATKEQPGRPSPNDVIEQAAKLEGVRGALIATQDGLAVARTAELPVNGEALAGFIPEIMNRITPYTRELRLGEAASVTLDFGACAMVVARQGKWFVAAFADIGKAPTGEQLRQLVGLLENDSSHPR